MPHIRNTLIVSIQPDDGCVPDLVFGIILQLSHRIEV